MGAKIEIKNLNSFSGVRRALAYEIPRQTEVLRAGGQLVQETRRWDDAAGVTESMRSKEQAHDYRYSPEPDLIPVDLTAAYLDSVRQSLPELPAARAARFVSDLGLPEYDAEVLTSEKDLADYFEKTISSIPQPQKGEQLDHD